MKRPTDVSEHRRAANTAIMSATSLALLLAAVGCIHVKTDPIKVEPIYIKADINIRVDKQLDEFFEDVEKTAGTPTTAPTTKPSSTLPEVRHAIA